tara:strand:- start:1244 stop:3520 length:2277 start_codon:yes stop_codon:yes gene_type:complete
MIELNKCFKLLDDGFSLITVGDNKIPNYSWKKCQSEQISKENFEKQYNYKGGIRKGNGDEMEATKNVGIVTGFDYLEVIDVDLKVFSTAKEQKDFWEEYLSLLKDNIFDFDDKFVVYKTKKNGYHILYKSKRVVGNKKIASLKGHTEAVIESRGIGGYVFLYDGKNQSEMTYKDVQFISDEDREILWSCSKTYDYVELVEIEIPKKTKKEYSTDGLKAWDDYNDKTNIMDLISDQFTIVRNLKDKYLIRRNGATSPHSGYIFKDSGVMFLYSSGTTFEAEKAYTPFTVYAHLRHQDNLSSAASDLYQQGYGDRVKVEPSFDDEEIKAIESYEADFPIEIFPESVRNYIKICNKTLNNSIDYMGCSLLFLTSIIIGNSTLIEIKKGWKESANIWLALIGKAGVGKTPSISSITFPLEKANNKEIKKYIKDVMAYEEYMNLDKKEKDLVQEVHKPKKSQFIVNDVTLEALIELHNENKNGIGVLKDELAGFFKDMNKYREGGDKEHWLSSWSGKQINLNRKTAKSSFVERACLPILGGIQPSIMDTFYTDENKDNGFIDRMLFSYPEMNIDYYSEQEMKQEHLDWYDNYILRFYENTKKSIRFTDDWEIDPIIATFTPKAKDEFIRVQNKLTDSQNSDKENEYMKSMLPKQKAYMARFSLIINTLESLENKQVFRDKIEVESVLKAEVLSDYFITMASKIKSNSLERVKTKGIVDSKKSAYENFKAVYSSNTGMKKTELAEILNVSRVQIYNYIKKYEDE